MREGNNRNNRRDRRESKYESKTVAIRRVAKVTAGGKRLRFSAMVVSGDKSGSVGVGLGRGLDTRNAVEKGSRKAEKNMTKIQLVGDTIPHEVIYKSGACKVMLRPAKPGTGIIAGSSVRTVLEVCGIDNVYGKILGSNDLIGNTYCTFEALKSLRNERVLAKMKNMQARIGLKEEIERERKKKELAARKLRQQNDKRGDNRGRKGGRFGGKRHDRRKPEAAVEVAKVDKPEVKVETEVKE
ncbi:MAG: 30S ribosomal protein S5 [Candidatus Dojkabacteria bacterium]|nr:MAG: 30S ribosomal protein S5 [Candidatus Dojkabacteria bacterium]